MINNYCSNRFIVPYNRGLLIKYQAHINVEWCNKGRLIKYLFKYVSKGPDMATMMLESKDNKQVENTSQLPHSNPNDEVQNYLSCRYISCSEACWRIFDFPIHYHKPAVQRLYFHQLLLPALLHCW